MAITAKQILESIPSRFRPEKAQDYAAVFHFDITGDEKLQYTVAINNGACQLSEGLGGAPDCVIAASSSVYVDLETGKANPQMTLMMGNVQVSNLAAMLRFSKCFRKFEETAPASAAQPKTRRPVKTGPLSGVKIIDFTRLLPGPLATMFLADMGADVMKVEDPDSPDYIRGFEPQVKGVSAYYLALNRSKRSLAINYLSPEGKQVIYDLVKKADVLVEQFRPGVMRELGFGYEELSKLNPKLVYVSITGYGQSSHKAMDAGHDLNYIAIAGALGITGTENGEPVIPGFQLADIAGGSYMTMNAVLAALYQRERTGKGEFVDVSMTDAVVPFSVLPFARYQATGTHIGRGEFELSGALANYNIYKCKDGKFLAVGSLEPKFWNAACARLNKPEWSSAFLNKGNDLAGLKAEVKALFLTKTQQEWLQFFKEDDICLTVINELEDLPNDPYLKERNMLVDNTHPAVGNFKTINQPLKFKHATFDNNWSAPDLGEDTESILKELNYTEQKITGLKQKNIVKLR